MGSPPGHRSSFYSCMHLHIGVESESICTNLDKLCAWCWMRLVCIDVTCTAHGARYSGIGVRESSGPKGTRTRRERCGNGARRVSGSLSGFVGAWRVGNAARGTRHCSRHCTSRIFSQSLTHSQVFVFLSKIVLTPNPFNFASTRSQPGASLDSHHASRYVVDHPCAPFWCNIANDDSV